MQGKRRTIHRPCACCVAPRPAGAGVYGPHGLEIISVAYDFSGPQARVAAWKVTGDHNVPAGQDTWWASAAPLPLPWSEHELHLQEARLW